MILPVVKINRNRPIFNQTVYNFSIEEESDIGLIVGTVHAGIRWWQQFTYKIESSNPTGYFLQLMAKQVKYLLTTDWIGNNMQIMSYGGCHRSSITAINWNYIVAITITDISDEFAYAGMPINWM